MPRKRREGIERYTLKGGDTIHNNPEGFICDKILELRQRSGCSQYKFSLKYHINIRSLQSWEIGRRAPMFAIPYLIEMLINYEEKYGYITDKKMSDDPCGDIVKLRWKSGLTQNAFGKKFCIREATLLRWEYNRATPRECIVSAIDKVLRYEEKYGALPDPEWVKELRYIL